MHLLIPCMKCLQEFGKPSGEFTRVEFLDDGKYKLTCSNGHDATTILQQQKFEVLFDIAAHAILDGYYRESVSSFAASLERFYEFSIRAFLSKASGSDNLFKSCWKLVSSQSERQLGGFIFLWASTFNASPALLSNKQVNFRNDVVHKGKIPTKEEAIAFGDYVLNVLRQNMLVLREQLPDAVQQVVFYHLRDAQTTGATFPSATMCASTIVSLSAGEASHHQGDLKHHLSKLLEWRAIANGVKA
ncbi:hypothetical protein [Xanthomonas arboricola]|uniref:hypothetical protein n=1 Tax=Xanthomonas arboricola TaxID=56448 RepID=UPI0009B8DB25|nr:hypothetical protein [Xanthomonas arboricola]